MSDLAATNCQNRGNGCDGGFGNCLLPILLLCCCGNGNGFGGDGNCCDIIWLLLILSCSEETAAAVADRGITPSVKQPQ